MNSQRASSLKGAKVARALRRKGRIAVTELLTWTVTHQLDKTTYQQSSIQESAFVILEATEGNLFSSTCNVQPSVAWKFSTVSIHYLRTHTFPSS